MKKLLTSMVFMALFCSASVLAFATGDNERGIAITRSGTQASVKGPTYWFTGTVRIDTPFAAKARGRMQGAVVTFEPGARTAWHTHPLGQTLIVTSGSGLVQRGGGPVETIRPGDIVRIAPGVRHWHGAAPATAMTHTAIQEAQDGKVVTWMEKVTDESYSGKSKQELARNQAHERNNIVEIKRIGSQPSVKGPAEWFTGTVRIDPMLAQANEPSRVTVYCVTFEPGARTAWHTHPLGQTLIVTAGCGRVQIEGRPAE